MTLVSMELLTRGIVHIFLTDLVEYWCLVCILMICFFPMEFPKALLQGHYVLCTILMLSAEYYVIME